MQHGRIEKAGALFLGEKGMSARFVTGTSYKTLGTAFGLLVGVIFENTLSALPFRTESASCDGATEAFAPGVKCLSVFIVETSASGKLRL
jgi:hypothetical protein